MNNQIKQKIEGFKDHKITIITKKEDFTIIQLDDNTLIKAKILLIN